MKTISGFILFLIILQGTGFATFTDNGNGTISDSKTQLMWMKETPDINSDSSLDDTDKISWLRAIQYCENLVFAGHSDWRLPNVKEISSISDKKVSQPSLPQCFEAISVDDVDNFYWTSTTINPLPENAWIIDFDNGRMTYQIKNNVCFVFAVRGGQ